MSLIEQTKQKMKDQEAAREKAAAERHSAYVARQRQAREQVESFIKQLGKIKGHTVVLHEKYPAFEIKCKNKVVACGGGTYQSVTRYDSDGGSYDTDEYYFDESFDFFNEKGESIYRTNNRSTFVEELIKRLSL